MEDESSTPSGVRRSSRVTKRLKSTPGDMSGTKNSSDSTHETPDAMPSLLSHKLILNHIFSFVGDFHYRLVGGVNQNFQKAYVSLYPMKQTRVNASTIEWINLCWDDIKASESRDDETKDKQKRALWHSAIRSGNKDIVIFLLKLLPPVPKRVVSMFDKGKSRRHWENDWRYDLCYKTAEYGHLELLKWAREKKICVFEEDERTLHYAYTSGHMEIFEWAFSDGCWLGEHTAQARNFQVRF